MPRRPVASITLRAWTTPVEVWTSKPCAALTTPVTSQGCRISSALSSSAFSQRSTSTSVVASSNQKLPLDSMCRGSEKISFERGKFWIVAKGCSFSRTT